MFIAFMWNVSLRYYVILIVTGSRPTVLLLLKPIVSCLLPSFPVYYFFGAKLIQKTLTNYDVNEVKITVITLQIRSN